MLKPTTKLILWFNYKCVSSFFCQKTLSSKPINLLDLTPIKSTYHVFLGVIEYSHETDDATLINNNNFHMNIKLHGSES